MNHTEFKDAAKVAIIGHPNVGKSSLFNRFLGHRKAIIEAVPGVTRDRLYSRIRFNGADLVLIDTGGIIERPKEKIAQLVYKQSRLAIDESDAVIFVCDLLTGLTYQDEHIAQILKKAKKKVFLVVNKVDVDSLKSQIFEFYRLGLNKPYAISCLHNNGLEELHADLKGYILAIGRHFAKKEMVAVSLRIAIVGRPNVGKSSFINCILNEERLLVDEIPGTTRDAVDVQLVRNRHLITLIDTAGMRHKRKIKETVEIFSLARAKESIRSCDVCIVMIDIMVGLLRDDINIIDYVITQAKPCILVVNKTDLVKDFDPIFYKKVLNKQMGLLEWIPAVFTSCVKKTNVLKAVDIGCELAKRSKVSIPTTELNNLIERLQRMKSHPFCGNIRPKIYYVAQTNTSPQEFLLFVNYPERIKKEYLRFIESHIRKEFNLNGVPINFSLRTRRKK